MPHRLRLEKVLGADSEPLDGVGDTAPARVASPAVEAEDAAASVATGAEPPKIVSNTESTTLEDDGLGAAFGAAAALEPCARDAVAAGVAVAAAVWEGALPLRLAASTAASTIEDVRAGFDGFGGCVGTGAVVAIGPKEAVCAAGAVDAAVEAVRVGVSRLVSTPTGGRCCEAAGAAEAAAAAAVAAGVETRMETLSVVEEEDARCDGCPRCRMDSIGADEEADPATLLSATALDARDLLKSICGPSPSPLSITLTPPVASAPSCDALGNIGPS